MFDYLIGRLTSANPHKTTLEVGGVGYFIWISSATFDKLPPIGETVQIFTSFIVREDSQKLYGFTKEQERDLFEILIEISGIGPRIALALLGHLSPEDLMGSIEHENIGAICKVPGIGKKMAQRLILELKGKLEKGALTKISSPQSSETRGLAGDAISALINLGYNPLKAQQAVKKVLSEREEEPLLPELISSALKNS